MVTRLRSELVRIALEWEERYGVAPQITSAISELDAASIIGMSEPSYSRCMVGVTAVRKGVDFFHRGKAYQVKANRPSGKRGSKVTLVSKPKNYDWDVLVWILYNSKYEPQEAWLWDVTEFRSRLGPIPRLSPSHLRGGLKLPV
jgi:hypothetical protein